MHLSHFPTLHSCKQLFFIFSNESTHVLHADRLASERKIQMTTRPEYMLKFLRDSRRCKLRSVTGGTMPSHKHSDRTKVKPSKVSRKPEIGPDRASLCEIEIARSSTISITRYSLVTVDRGGIGHQLAQYYSVFSLNEDNYPPSFPSCRQ